MILMTTQWGVLSPIRKNLRKIVLALGKTDISDLMVEDIDYSPYVFQYILLYGGWIYVRLYRSRIEMDNDPYLFFLLIFTVLRG